MYWRESREKIDRILEGIISEEILNQLNLFKVENERQRD